MSESRARARRRSARRSFADGAGRRSGPGVTVVKARDAADILASVPFHCGFQPEHSLVVISLRGPRRRIGLVTRVDLPPEDASEEAADVTLDYLTRDEAVAAVVIVYDDAPWSAASQPHRGLAVAVSDRLELAGIAVKDALYVAGDRFWSYQCFEERCCPIEGRSMSEVRESPICAAYVLAGVAPLASREDLVARVTPADPDLAQEVEGQAWRWLQAHARDLDGSPTQDTRERHRAQQARRIHWLLLTVRLVCRQLGDYADGRSLAPETAGQLLAALTELEIRDVVMALFCETGLPRPPEELVPDLPTRVVDALEDVVATLDSAEGAFEDLIERLLIDLSTRAEGWLACAPLTLLAWHSWARGEGALARVAAERAVAEDPTYRLARLVLTALDAGLAPDWVSEVRAQDRSAG